MTVPPRRTSAGLLAALALPLFACATGQTVEGDRAVIGQPAVLTARALEGEAAFDLATLQGKVVIVDFWASWCEPCRASMPFYEDLYQRHRADGFEVVAVSIDEDVALARRFMDSVSVSFTVVWDADHVAAERFRPRTMPSSYVIDRQGVVRHVHVGFLDETREATRAQVLALLQAPAGEPTQQP